MSNLDKLVAKGAYSCGGELLFKNKVMGTLRNGEFFISDEGKAELEVLDVDAKEAKPRAKKTPKTEPAPAVEPPVAVDDDLSDLIGE